MLGLSILSMSSADKGDSSGSLHGMVAIVLSTFLCDQTPNKKQLRGGSRFEWISYLMVAMARQQDNEAAGQITSTLRKCSTDRK